MGGHQPREAPLPDVEVLDVFEIDRRGRLVTLEPGRRMPTRPSRPPVTARPTKRPPPPSRQLPKPQNTAPAPPPGRTRGRRDIRRAIFIDPVVAADRLADDRLLSDISGLDLTGPGTGDGATTSWNVDVRPSRWGPRVAAELTIHPSRSWVMTVIELRPTGRWWFRGAFIRAGLRITDEIGDRLDRAAA